MIWFKSTADLILKEKDKRIDLLEKRLDVAEKQVTAERSRAEAAINMLLNFKQPATPLPTTASFTPNSDLPVLEKVMKQLEAVGLDAPGEKESLVEKTVVAGGIEVPRE